MRADTLLTALTIEAAPLRRLLTLGLLLAALTGCRTGYYIQAGLGQLELLCGSEDIEDVLAREDLDPELRRKLSLVPEVMRFGRERMALADNDNYTEYYDLKGRSVTYSVLACPADSLDPYTWTFPIVGVLPYIGFFDREDADEEAARLQAEGYDTAIYPATAYSTLGWFDDPVLSSMVEGDEIDMVSVLLHEQTHATLYIEGDIAFNETLATFMGHAGAVAFYRERGELDKVEEAGKRRRDELRVQRFCEKLISELKALYASKKSRAEKIADKQKVFARAHVAFSLEVYPKLLTDRYGSYRTLPSNNAVVSVLGLYNRDFALLEALHSSLGEDIARTFETLKEMAATGDPKAALEARVGALVQDE